MSAFRHIAVIDLRAAVAVNSFAFPIPTAGDRLKMENCLYFRICSKVFNSLLVCIDKF